MKGFLFTLALICTVACSTKNAATPYSKDTPEEAARRALDNEDYAAAIEGYGKIVEDAPTRYDLYPLLAAALGGAAGLDIVNIVKAQFAGASSGQGLFAQLGSYIPAEPTEAQLQAIRDAVDVLQSMPESERDPAQSSNDYASAAAFQLTLYLAVSSTMNINRFVSYTESGSLDPAKLEMMTDADVEAILGNLEDIAAAHTGGVNNEALRAKTDITIAEINAQPGDTQKEKLISYLNQQQSKLIGY